MRDASRRARERHVPATCIATVGCTPNPVRMRIHLDLLGGLAGDMFIAALLDAFPHHEAGMLASIEALNDGRGAECRLVAHRDAVLVGRRFEVDEAVACERHLQHDHHHEAGHDHSHPGGHVPARSHAHTTWRSIRTTLSESTLEPSVLKHAVGLFTLLAEAEAAVHGVAVDDVAFHEVGAWDSIADIVGAAHLIAALGAVRWSTSAVPLGFGRVRTAHGPMPVPAPATARLLAGFATIDDGIGGERVTPTGAALVRYLCRELAGAPARTHPAATLRHTGIGFGTRVLPGISNCVRVLVFDDADVAAAATPTPAQRQIAVIEFEVDDQSAEDLAMGLEHLRANAAVFDVVQSPVFGKKGRMMTAVRVLASPAALGAVIDACFRETTTIGLRHHVVGGSALSRQQHELVREHGVLRVKAVERPGGATAKTEADDVAAYPGHATRRAMRAQAERDALAARSAASTVAGTP